MTACILFAYPEKSSAASKPVFFPEKTWSDVKKTAEKGIGTRYVLGGRSLKGWDCTGYVDWIQRNTCGYCSYMQGRSEEVLKKYKKVAEGYSYSAYVKYVKQGTIRPGDIIKMITPAGKSIHVMLAGEGTYVYHAWCVKTGTIKNSFASVWSVDGPGGNNFYGGFHAYRGVDPKGTFKLKLQSSNNVLTKDNSGYSFSGAKYTLTKSGKKYVVKTNKNGKATLKNIPTGTYKLKMTAAAKNYVIDKKTRKVKIKNEKTNTVTIKLIPVVKKNKNKKSTEKTADKEAAASSDGISDEVLNEKNYKSSDEISDNALNEKSDEKPKKASDEVLNGKSDKVLNEASVKVPAKASVKAKDGSSVEASDEKPEKTVDKGSDKKHNNEFNEIPASANEMSSNKEISAKETVGTGATASKKNYLQKNKSADSRKSTSQNPDDRKNILKNSTDTYSEKQISESDRHKIINPNKKSYEEISDDFSDSYQACNGYTGADKKGKGKDNHGYDSDTDRLTTSYSDYSDRYDDLDPDDSDFAALDSDVAVSDTVPGIDEYNNAENNSLQNNNDGYDELINITKSAGICSIISLVIYIIICRTRKNKDEDIF